jgi:ABC-type nickel/cobalt efflux system permease component RcnA
VSRLRPRARAALLLSTGACLATTLAAAPAASAHPLGNATVNHYDGLLLSPRSLTDTAVEDVAEIPTLQRKPLIDGDGDGRLSAAELATYARRQCASLAAGDRITAGGTRLRLRVVRAEYGERPGAIGLSVGRLVCRLTAAVDLSRPTAVTIEDEWDGAGIGWHELTAVGDGVTLRDSPVPARSISDELRRYPNDLLSSPLDQRSATLHVVPGNGASTYAGSRGIPTAGAASRFLAGLTTTFDGLVGRQHLTLGVGLLAVLLAMVLGAGHAFLPGHGKTVMAAYLVGRRGRLRDVIAVGATVTLTHTAGVLVIGLLLTLSATLAPTALEQDLAVLSGLIVAGVGLWLLISAVRGRRRAPDVQDELATLAAVADEEAPAAVPLVSAGTSVAHPHAHSHAHPHPHEHHEHGHGDHVHPHGVPGEPLSHGHPHEHEPTAFSRKGLIGLGVAGGLVPSPSALLVLLAAVALGRTVFGIVLVLGYGVGMAAALTAAGLLLLRLRGRLGRIVSSGRLRRVERLVRALPVLTACLVLVVGLGLALQALTGTV